MSSSESEWELVAKNIDHEFWLMQNLRAYTNYEFRLAAMNHIGWGPVGPSSPIVRTHFPGKILNYLSKNIMLLFENINKSIFVIRCSKIGSSVSNDKSTDNN